MRLEAAQSKFPDAAAAAGVIDGQHARVFGLVREFVAAARSRARPPRLVRIFDRLITATREHFATEEAFLRALAVPGLEHHLRTHRHIAAEFADFRSALAGVEPPDLLACLHIGDALLVHHVRDEPASFARRFDTGTEHCGTGGSGADGKFH